MTEFEAGVILAMVRSDAGMPRGALCATVGMALGRPSTDQGVILTFMDNLEGQRLIQRYHAAAGYHITPSGIERLREIRSKILGGINLINASY